MEPRKETFVPWRSGVDRASDGRFLPLFVFSHSNSASREGFSMEKTMDKIVALCKESVAIVKQVRGNG